MATSRRRCHFTVNHSVFKLAAPGALLLSSGCIDNQPPVLAAAPPPAGVQRGDVVVEIFVEDKASLTGQIDDGPAIPLTESPWRIPAAALADEIERSARQFF